VAGFMQKRIKQCPRRENAIKSVVGQGVGTLIQKRINYVKMNIQRRSLRATLDWLMPSARAAASWVP